MEKRIDKNDNKFERDNQTDEKKTLENENESVSIKDNILEEKDGEIKKSFPKIFDAFDKNINDEYINIPNEYANLSEQAEKLLNNRGYYISGFDKDGNEFFHESKFNQFCRRISRCLASAETLYTKDIERIKIIEYNIHKDIFNKRFTFNSPALFNLGKGFCDQKNKIDDHNLIYHKNLSEMTYEDYEYIYNSRTTKQMLFACFVVGIEDNLESIMDGIKDAALVSKAGGGVGFNFGNTRERNALVYGGVCGKASGPVSWIHMYNEMGNSVVQGGTRRAALMGMLYDNHPDLFEFMHCKDEEGILSKFNISVAVSNVLMDSIINNRSDDIFKFYSRRDGKEVTSIPTGIYATNSRGEKEMTFIDTKDITCGKVWNDLCEHAWKRGDPGIAFIDVMNYDNILKEDTTGDYIIESTNPCVTGDTLVSTPDGYKHAKDVKVGDYISTLSGPDKVDRIEVNENMPVYKVTMSDGDFVKVTESHKFHAIKKNSKNKEYENISLKDLEVGDYIELSGSILPNNKIETFGMEDYDFGFIIGVLFGDGCVTENAIEHNHIGISFGKQNIEWRNTFENILKKYEDLKYYVIDEKQTTTEIVFRSKNIIYKIINYYKFGGNAGTKNIPMEVMNSNKDVLCGLLDGYFSTDGHIGLSTDKHNPKISIKSINYDLLRSIRMILLMFDMKSSIYYYKRKENDMYIEGRKVNAKDTYEVILLANSIDKFCETIHITNPIKNGKLQKISEKSYGRFSTRKISIKSIEKLEGLHTVYDIHCPTDNWITQGYVNTGCGEQPLPNFTSCNLGSINLNAFLFPNENGTLDFNIRELSDQIIRSIYYLDLIIDASSFPVKKIEERTKAIRPVGLGFMGLADLAFRCNLSYNSNEFKNLCNIIGQIYAGTSMYATVEICKENLKEPFQENNLVKILFKNNKITDELIDNGTIDEIISAISISKIPPTTINAILSLKTFFNIYGETFKEYDTFDDFLKEMLRNISKGNIRNSRRLSEAPTGCQSKDTYVITNKGILRFDEIGDINSEEPWTDINNINIEQENTYTKASKFYINGNSKTKKITTQLGIELEATPNHMYRVLDENKEYVWKSVEDLKVNDILVYKMGEYNNEENPKFNFDEYVKHPNALEDVIFPESMNEDLAYFIGFYCGNGNLHRIKNKDAELRLFFNKAHTSKIEKIKEICKKLFNYDLRTYPSDNKREQSINLITLHIVNREIIYKLNKLGALKENSKNVSIPKIIRMSSKECIKAFLDGLYDADGSTNGYSKYIDTSSKQFSQELLIIMRAIGINGRIKIDTKRTGSKGKDPMYRIYFNTYGSETFKPENVRYVKCEYRNYHNDLIKISDRLYGEKIIKIENSENITYDIEVPEDHYYIANSFISHNSTSMIMDASSGIEPLFALSWGRKVVSNKTTDDTTIQFSYIYKYLNDDERKKLENGEMLKGDKYLCANDLNIDDHLAPIGIFGKYIDSAISKTCNLPNSATVDDVKKAYEKAFKLGCKGITIYRDGSRDSQPITRTDNKVEVQKEKDGIRLVNKKRERPKFARGITENVETSNYGKLYVTVNFDEENEPFEVFISLGKSGSEITSLVDACARLISISLRSNTDIKDLIKTLINMDSSNPWLYDSDINGMVVMTSIPDAIAKLIIEIMDHKDEVLSKSSECKCDKKEELDSMDKHIFKETALGGVIECPKCHKNTYTLFNGCRTCINPECGYSGCDAI